MEELIGFEFALQADGVQIQIAHQAELIAQAVVIGAQQHILRPAAATNQDGLAVHAEETAAVGRQFRGDLTESEVHALLIGGLALNAEAHGEALEMRLAHLAGPPGFGIANMQLWKLFRSEGHTTVLMRRQLDRLLEADPSGGAGNQPFDRVIGSVVQLGVDGQVGRVERLAGEVRDSQRRAQGDRAGRDQIDPAREAHVLIRRRGIPIDPIDAQILFRGREGLHRQHIGLAGFQKLGHIEVISAICSGDLCRIRDFVAVQPDFSAVIDTGEMQPESLIFLRCGRRLKFVAIPPAAFVWTVLRHGQVGK